MDNTAIVNASPLIFMSRGRQIHLLHHFADRILVPQPVAEEIRRKGISDITFQTLENTSWIDIVPAPPVPESILEWGLGPGESAVLTLAYGYPEREAIIDDLAGRKCAAFHGIPVRGTLGLVLVAKRRGLIPKARPVMEILLREGLYLSSEVLNRALKRVGE